MSAKIWVLIILVAVIAYSVGYYQKSNSVVPATVSQVSIDDKIKCHDEAIQYRDDNNKNPDPRLYAIKPYDLLGSGYNVKSNTCVALFNHSFLQLSGNLVEDEEIIDVLPSTNYGGNFGTWYGDAANGHPDKGFFLDQKGNKDTNYGDWAVKVSELLNN